VSVPVSDEDKARMLQSEDIGDLIRYIACLPSRVCLNDVLITPTWNRAYISAQDQGF
jgi:NADP-dependent 3-hydroxy acid dehydrogenase YdfG